MKNLDIASSVTSTIKPAVNADLSKAQLNKDKLQAFIKEEIKFVKGRFRCYETPGSMQRIQQRKYKDAPLFDKWMTDGEVYEIPLWVARWLNGIDVTATAINGKINSCSYPIHGFKMGHAGDLKASQDVVTQDGPSLVPVDNIVKRERRYGFESLEFSIE